MAGQFQAVKIKFWTKKCQLFSKKCQILGSPQKSAKPGKRMPQPKKVPKKCQIFKKVPNQKIRCQTPKKSARFLEFGIKSAKLAALKGKATKGCQLPKTIISCFKYCVGFPISKKLVDFGQKNQILLKLYHFPQIPPNCSIFPQIPPKNF